MGSWNNGCCGPKLERSHNHAITALTIGLGIDYSIHMWRRFEDELEAGANRVEAMATTYSVTGTALDDVRIYYCFRFLGLAALTRPSDTGLRIR